MSYSTKLIRGIFNEQYIQSDGTPTANLFFFNNQPPAERTDNNFEESINWHDDELAIQNILELEKEPGVKKFKSGAVILFRSKIDSVSRELAEGKLSYERDKKPENDYHGNLLLDKSVSKPKMRLIAACIALCYDEIVNSD